MARLVERLGTIVYNGLEILEADKTEEGKKKKKALMLDTVRSVLDIPVAMYFINNRKVDEGMAGFLGMITSVIGISQVWESIS